MCVLHWLVRGVIWMSPCDEKHNELQRKLNLRVLLDRRCSACSGMGVVRRLIEDLKCDVCTFAARPMCDSLHLAGNQQSPEAQW